MTNNILQPNLCNDDNLDELNSEAKKIELPTPNVGAIAASPTISH
jgi:hypothetical protein